MFRHDNLGAQVAPWQQEKLLPTRSNYFSSSLGSLLDEKDLE